MSRDQHDLRKVNETLRQLIVDVLADQPVAYHPIITKAVGSATAGIFLSQMLYWVPRTSHPEGWVYKTQKDILDETGLTRTEQETARRVLRKTNVLEEAKRGLPAKLYFRVNLEQLFELLATAQPARVKRQRSTPEQTLPDGPAGGTPNPKDAGFPQPWMQDSRRLARSNAADRDAGFPQPLKRLTETTTEITTEIVGVVARDALKQFGISPQVATSLAATYPEGYILAKLDLVQWLQEHRPTAVGKNASGYLRRAIEDDWTPPPGYQPPEQRATAAQQRDAERAAEQEQRRQLEQEQAHSREEMAQQLAEGCPPRPIPDSALSTATAWSQALAILEGQMTAGNFTFVRQAKLAHCDDHIALVVAPYSYHLDQLSGRFHHAITQALSTVLGHPLHCEYTTLTRLAEQSSRHLIGAEPEHTARRALA